LAKNGRKDDLESIGYMLVYMYKGKLPWQGIRHKEKKEKYRLIGQKKSSITDEELCSGMPKEFVVFLKYVRNLDFDEIVEDILRKFASKTHPGDLSELCETLALETTKGSKQEKESSQDM